MPPARVNAGARHGAIGAIASRRRCAGTAGTGWPPNGDTKCVGIELVILDHVLHPAPGAIDLLVEHLGPAGQIGDAEARPWLQWSRVSVPKADIGTP